MSRSLSAPVVPWTVALLFVLAAGRAGAAPTPDSPTNLLANPGFEEPYAGHPWMPAEWDTSKTESPTVFFGRDTFLVHGGSYAVNIANTGILVPIWHNWNQAVLVGPETWGKDLVFSVWTRSNGLAGRAYVLIQAYRDTIGKMAKLWGIPRDPAARRMNINKMDDPLLDLGWKRLYFDDPETGWVQREVRVFVPPTTSVVYVRCGLLGTGQVIFDDASLSVARARPAPPLPAHKNLLADPGFEGDGHAWEYSMPPYEGQRIDRDTTQARSGKACIRFTSGVDGMIQARAGVCQVFDHRLAGKRLRLTGWVKTDSLRGGLAYLKLYCNSLSRGMIQCEPGKVLDMTNDWTLLSLEMDAPADVYAVWGWFAYNVPSSGIVYYDDTSLEIVGPAGGERGPKPAGRPARPSPPAAKKPAP
jgi:hypothetical protein